MSSFLNSTDTNRLAVVGHKLLRPGVLVTIALMWVTADLMMRFLGHVNASWQGDLDAFAALVLFVGVVAMALQERIAKSEQLSEHHAQHGINQHRFYVVDGGCGLPASPQETKSAKPAILTCIDGGSFSLKEQG
jgi:uncharacterized membrane protein